jgi:hypothetical protein
MLRYFCDLCGREIDPESEPHFVVRIEVHPSLKPPSPKELEEEIDHLEELQQLLENLDDSQLDSVPESLNKSFRFDLCVQCRDRFVKQPLGREPRKVWQFSKN